MDKTKENRLRRMANRQGLILRKSPRRDRRAVDYGMYALVDRKSRGTVHPEGPISPYSLTADDVCEWLEVEEEQMAHSLMNSSLGEPYQMESIPRHLHKYIPEDELKEFKRKPKAPPIREVDVELVDFVEETAKYKRRIAEASEEELVEIKAEIEEFRKAGMRYWVEEMEPLVAAREAE